jgi:SH3-like domain-containing protein
MTTRDGLMRAGAALALVAMAWPAQAQLRPLARPTDLSIPSPEEAIVPVSATQAVVPPAPSVGPETNLPLPRFVSLKTDEGNARRGPSLDHRIDWVFVREDMPLRITAEYGHWRRVEDREGLGGWIHYSLLSGTRTAIVDQDQLPLRTRPEDQAPEVALLEQNVVARLEICEIDWCRIGAGGYGGWVPKAALWGVEAQEILD